MRSLFLTLLLLCSAPLMGASPAEPAPLYAGPIDLSGPRPTIELQIDGLGPFPFVLDTGAAVFVVRPSLLEAVPLEVSGTTTVSSPGGDPVPVDEVTVDSVGFAGVDIGSVTAVHLDSMGPGLGDVHGVLGPVFFERFGRTLLDFEHGRFELGGALTADDGAIWLPMGEDYPLLGGTVRMGEAALPVHVDTGNPGAVALPYSDQAALPLDGPPVLAGRARTVDRAFDIFEAPTSAPIEFGDLRVQTDKVTLFDRDIANIGMGSLRGAVIEIDWANRRYRIDGDTTARHPQRRRRRSAPAAEAAETADVVREPVTPTLVQQCLDAAVQATGYQGVVSVTLGGSLAASGAFGTSPVTGVRHTLDTPFHSASTGKIFTAIAVARLAEAGAIDFEDRIGDHVPDLPEEFARVTIGQLLSHTAGYGNLFGPGRLDTLAGATRAQDYLPLVLADPPAFAPGERTQYSNSGFAMLGILLEVLTGQTYEAHVTRTILEPLGMTGTHFRRPENASLGLTRMSPTGRGEEPPHPPLMADWPAMAAGGFYTTAPDLTRFLTALKQGELVRPETLAVMSEVHAERRSRRTGELRRYGYGLVLNPEHGVIGHGGGSGAINAEARLDIEDDYVIAALSITDPPSATRLADRLENLLEGAAGPVSCGASPGGR